MAYFKIGETDFSQYVNSLKVNKKATYNSQTNAAGNTVVDFINAKRTIEVGIIPVDAEALAQLLAAVDSFLVSISFLNPHTNIMEEGIRCIIPSTDIDYYTIQTNKVMSKAFTLTFTEL